MSSNKLSIIDKLVRFTIEEDLLKEYSANTYIRTLIQRIPYGAMVDSMLTVSYNNILVDRAKTFFNELSRGNIELTEEIIQNEGFLHAYYTTFRASLYTKQRKNPAITKEKLI